MDTRSRTLPTASWIRRTSWKVGSMFGAIAKRLAAPSIPISAVLLARSSTAAVHPEQPLEDVAQMFVANRATQMPVIDHGVAIGVITRIAIRETLEHDGPHTPAGLVRLSDVVVVQPDAAVDDVMAELEDHPGAVALILDHGAPLGMITREQLDAYLDERVV